MSRKDHADNSVTRQMTSHFPEPQAQGSTCWLADGPTVLHRGDVIADHATLVELWASALSGFAQPIPPYELNDKYRLGARRS